MVHIKNLGLVFLLQMLVLVNLKADMLFYYSAAVLPSIISNTQPIAGLWSGKFVSEDGTTTPMTALIAANNEIRIFSLELSSNPNNQTIDKHMDGVLNVTNGAFSSTLDYYYNDNNDGIGTLTSTLSIAGKRKRIGDEDEGISDTLSGTYTSVNGNGTFVFRYTEGGLPFEEDETQLAFVYASLLDSIGNVYINQAGEVSGEYGSCQYSSGQFSSIDPNSNIFRLTLDYKCNEEITSYAGLAVIIPSEDGSEYDDDEILWSVSNGQTSIIDYLAGQY